MSELGGAVFVLLALVAFAACVGGPVVLVVFLVRRAKQHQQELAAARVALIGFATAREWRFAEADPSLIDRFSGRPFGEGHSRRATNVLYGRHRGRHLVAFDYQYSVTSTSGTGTDSRTHTSTSRFSVVAVSLGVTMPDLTVAPQGAVGRFINRLTGSDLLLGWEPFDRAFAVRTTSPEFAHDMLHPLMQTLMQWPDLTWLFEGDSLLVIRGGRNSPQEVDGKLGATDAILERIPPHVWSRIGLRPE